MDAAEPPAAEPTTVEQLAEEQPVAEAPLDRRALWSLAAQHLSSSWGARCYEFAVFLFLVELYPNSLLRVSIYGLLTTGAGIVFSGSIGGLVDVTGRLKFVRGAILAQKGTASIAYALLLILFLHPNGGWEFPLLIISGGLLKLATVGMSVAVERDWVTVIADGGSHRLTQLNTYLRRIDLITALVGPLFVSLLTTAGSYVSAASFLLGFGLVSGLVEFFWIQVVFSRCPILATEEHIRNRDRAQARVEAADKRRELSLAQRFGQAARTVGPSLRQSGADWHNFVRQPVFASSLALALLYLTVLSFDGTLLAYLITHNWSPALLAGLRGVQVVCGLAGTVVMPYAEKRIGLIRTGTWSIVSEVVFLLPVLLSFYIGAPPLGERGAAWNAVLLFGGMSLSRISLWSFDLVQLKILQIGLADNPRRNALTALQYSLANSIDLLKYVLTIVLSDPSQFKYAALVSWVAVLGGALAYLSYVKQQRGHVLHLGEWQTLLKKHR